MAFWRLSNARPSSGFGPLPIPFTEMAAYLDLHRVTDLGVRETFVAYVQALDAEWLGWAARQAKERKGKRNG